MDIFFEKLLETLLAGEVVVLKLVVVAFLGLFINGVDVELTVK